MAPMTLAALLAGAVAIAGPVAFPPQMDCVKIQSPSKLAAGSTFHVPIQRGLEFRLSKDWEIGVGPSVEPTLDYLWLVSPPLQFAPQRYLRGSYYVSAAESAKLERSLRFVLNREDYNEARVVMNWDDAGASLKRLDELGRGVLILHVDKYELTDDGKAFRWISFRGEACVPKAPE